MKRDVRSEFAGFIGSFKILIFRSDYSTVNLWIQAASGGVGWKKEKKRPIPLLASADFLCYHFC